MDVTDTDVLVVGAGPSGLTASTLLATYGVDAITVTKHESTAPTPRAHFTNQRSMEIFRALGFEDEVWRIATPIHSLGNNVWATSFSGRELARIPAWGTGMERKGEYDAASPCGIWNAPQHVLEPIILAGARDAGADVRFRKEVTAVEQTDEHVLVTVCAGAEREEHIIRARYVIGADGGRSTVAEQAGFDFEGITGVLHWAVNVWLEADLAEYCAHRPGVLYWIHEPGSDFHSSTWSCVWPWTEWVMGLLYPAAHGEPHLDEAMALEQARSMIDDPCVDVSVKAISPWAVGAALATEYRKGRIFLAGDSAHHHPPPNGLGSNSGIQDAFNLCWKLAMVLSGTAGEDLLDSYHAERQPVGRLVIDRAMTSLRNVDPLLAAFGFGANRGEEDDWARLAELSSGEDRGRERRRALRDALRLQEGQFNAHGVEYGQRYSSGALITNGSSPPPPARDPQLYYEPSTFPGSPLPHAWIEHKRTRLSTLDVANRQGFTVITGIGGEGWLRAAQQTSEALGVPITSVSIGYQQEYHDIYGDWALVREIDEAGCLLVRPDRHIAWRVLHRAEDPIRELREAVQRLLYRV